METEKGCLKTEDAKVKKELEEMLDFDNNEMSEESMAQYNAMVEGYKREIAELEERNRQYASGELERPYES